MTDQVAEMIDDLLAPGPGNILRSAREDKGLSLRQAADKLHLLPRQVEALETNDYQQFNGEIFCKGYLKAYATLLDIAAEPLIKAYMDSRPAETEPVPSAKPRTQIQRPAKGHSIQYWSLGATVVVILILWLLNSDNETEAAPVVAEPLATVVDKNTAIATADPAVEEPQAVIDQTAMEAVPVAAEEALAVVEPGQETVVEVSVEPEVTEAPPVNEDTLNFSFARDCWVEVKDANGTMIFADLKRANATLSLNGEGPFNVLLGYAPGVTLSYNGEPVDVVVNRKKDSARLTVGE